jgi:hypothetical protein
MSKTSLHVTFLPFPPPRSGFYSCLSCWLTSAAASFIFVSPIHITEHPIAQWTAQQIVEAFPWDTAPRYLLRDRDSTYSDSFQSRVRNMGIEEVKIAPRSPWQNPYCERVICSIRRDALDHVIVLNEQHLRRVLRSYVDYYHQWRTHRSLEMDAPEPRVVQPAALGPVRKLPEVGGLHHHYEHIAA